MNSKPTRAVPAPSHLGLAFMALSSGSLDVIAFLLLGHVFASAMTGNAALLGIALSDGNWLSASQPATALLGFIAGASFASILFDPKQVSARRASIIRTLLVIEAGCLVVFAILWMATNHPPASAAHYTLILVCSFAMGIQGIAAKYIHAPGLNTIVFTSTLVAIVSATVQLLLGRETGAELKSETRFQASVFAAYGIGAVIAGLLYWSGFAYLMWLPAVAVIASIVCQSGLFPVRER